MLQPGAIVGKYRIDRQLGHGGMGVVFLAYDPTLQRSVAIKVLTPVGDGESARAQLLREARSASAINHPNICTVYEVGEDRGCQFIAMEYIDGRCLRDLIDGVALPLQDALRYAIEVADALAHAHQRGVVHGDLKAANALVSSTGRLKIVDFGLARRTDVPTSEATTRTSHTGTVVGTPYAMAPEQVRGKPADARTDLWALGVLLFELLSGTRPFRGATVPDIFSSILRDPPAALPPQTPDPLREIVHHCLVKDPTERYQRAADVRLALEATADGLHRQGSAAVAPGITAGPSGAPLPPPLIFTTATESTAFVGREHELEQMAHAWDAARTGRRQVILVSGEPGIGKTRLSLNFARECAESGATVLVGHSDEEALVPYQPIIEALSWYVRVCPEPDLRAHFAGFGAGAELAPLVPELLRRLPNLPAPPAMNPEGQRYRLFEAVAAWLAGTSMTHPVLLLFDDLHWADKPTLLMLRHVVRSLATARVCIVGTYRESELGRTHPLAETLAAFRLEPGVTRLALRGLDKTQVGGLIATISGPEVAAQLTSVVTDSTGGNPFFVTEVLRHLKETGALSKFPSDTRVRGVAELGLPEGVKEVITRRVSRLSEACGRVLTLAAVIGREFDLRLLDALHDLPEDTFLDALDEAIAAKLIAETPQDPARFAFLHALVRETLYEGLTSSRRIRLHRRVGEAIEGLALGGSKSPLADLAYHFVQAAPGVAPMSGGPVDKAIDYATRAGDRAADALAHEEAGRLYDMALQSVEFKEAGPDAETRRVDLYTRRAHAFGALGQWALQKQDLEHALQHLPPEQVERRCELIVELANASHFLLDTASTAQLAAQALELAEAVHRSDLAADALAVLASCRQAVGDLPGAIDMNRAAIARAGGVKRRAHALGALSLYLAGRTTEAVTLGSEAATIARSSRDTAFVMYALPHYALILGGVGNYRDAQNVFDEARQFGRKYGVLPMLARAIAMSAGFHLNVFDFDGAQALQEEARELAKSVGFAPPAVSAGIDLLFTLARRGDPGGAAETLLREVEAAIATTPGWHEWLWRMRLGEARAELAFARGAFESAITEATESIAESRSRSRPKYEALGLLTRARALRALGRTRDAITDARRGAAVARGTIDPSLQLQALDVLLSLDGDDHTAASARTISDRMEHALPDDTMRRRFGESAIVQRLRRV